MSRACTRQTGYRRACSHQPNRVTTSCRYCLSGDWAFDPVVTGVQCFRTLRSGCVALARWLVLLVPWCVQVFVVVLCPSNTLVRLFSLAPACPLHIYLARPWVAFAPLPPVPPVPVREKVDSKRKGCGGLGGGGQWKARARAQAAQGDLASSYSSSVSCMFSQRKRGRLGRDL